MDKKEIINIYKKKLNDLKDHNRSYFSKDKPKISDHEYDSLKKDVLKLENNYPYLKKFGTAGNIVGSPPSNKFKKIKHLKPMLSLSNAFDQIETRRHWSAGGSSRGASMAPNRTSCRAIGQRRISHWSART